MCYISPFELVRGEKGYIGKETQDKGVSGEKKVLSIFIGLEKKFVPGR